MLPALHKQLHIYIFHEMVKGRYNPCMINKNQHETLNSLVIKANTSKVASLLINEKPEQFAENNDLTVLGYKSTSDYEIEIRKQPDEKCDLYVKPLFIYELNDPIDIPKFNGFKTNCYLEFMGDEFERIKVRAEKLFCSGTRDIGIRDYATRHVQLTKNLFYETKLLLRNILRKNNSEDIFIVYALNLFLVKTILFYQDAFKTHLATRPDIEGQLNNEVYKELPLRKLFDLISEENSQNNSNTKKSFVVNTLCAEAIPSEIPVINEKTVSGKKTQQAAQGIQAFERIKVNGQINVLVDVFFQMLRKKAIKDDKEITFIETTPENLHDFILACFKDNNDKSFSWHTIHTYLKPYRSDKHIKDGSKRKIDISDQLNGF